MKKPHFDPTGAIRGGAYSVVITAVVLAILIALNVAVAALPASATEYDISASKLYSVTSNTKSVVNALTDDVTIYWIVQAAQEDAVIEKLLDRYEGLSDHITVEKRNPDVYPTFAEEYIDEDDTVYNNSLVVECGERSRYIPYTDIYVTDADMYSYYYSTSFDGEGAITSAIDYVTNPDQPAAYTLTGHGESALPATFADSLEKENITVEELSLLNTDAIPEDADVLIIYAPQSDISEEEAGMLSEYVRSGGKLLVMGGPVEDAALTNLYSVLEPYGVTPVEGVVVEGDRAHYALTTPAALMPEMASGGVTDALIEEGYYIIMPVATGLEVGDNSTTATVTSLLTTSDAAFSKLSGYDMTTYEKEEGDIDGPFSLGVQVEYEDGGAIVWFSSSAYLNDLYNAYSSGANNDLTMNAMSSLVGESEAMSIRSKSLNYNYLTISDSTAGLLKVLMIGVFPLAFLAAGIAVVAGRRRLLK